MNKQSIEYDISELDNDLIAINLKSGKHDGGYISIKFDDDGIAVDMFNASGDVISSTWAIYNEMMELKA